MKTVCITTFCNAKEWDRMRDVSDFVSPDFKRGAIEMPAGRWVLVRNPNGRKEETVGQCWSEAEAVLWIAEGTLLFSEGSRL